MATFDDITRKLQSCQKSDIPVNEVIKMLQNMKQPSEQKTQQQDQWQDGPSYVFSAPKGHFTSQSRTIFGDRQTRVQTQNEKGYEFRFAPIQIMVLTDGSEYSHKACEAALHFRRKNDYIHVVNFVQLVGADDKPEYKEANKALRNKGKCVVDEAREEISRRDIPRWTCTSVAATDPKKEALKYMQEKGVNVVFVGTRGVDTKTPTGGNFQPGSFAKYIVENSDISIMVVR